MSSLTEIEDVQRLSALNCRSCGASGLAPVLSLGRHPLANSLSDDVESALAQPRYPLELALCGRCGLLQLTYSVPPEEMFSDYPYFSSVIPGLVAHAQELATRMVAERGLDGESLVIEVASNDGYLLGRYAEAGIPVLGVEPARNIAAVAEERGIPTRCLFFGADSAEELRAEGLSADVMHAHNVLAHVPDPNGFVDGIARLLAPRGRAVIEAPYVRDLLDRGEFDTIYHEHLFYYSLTALEALFARHGLEIEDVERIPIHGGSLRLFIAHSDDAEITDRRRRLAAEEEGWAVREPAPYLELAGKVEAIVGGLRELLVDLGSDGRRTAAYGAAAKGSTLLNTATIGTDALEFVVDRSPHKQGRYMPGSALPILAPEVLVGERRPDYLLILAWNFAEEIFEQQRAYSELGGRFIVPVPEPRIV